MLRPPVPCPRLLAGLLTSALAGVALLPAPATAADGELDTVTVTVTGGGYPLDTVGQVQVTSYYDDGDTFVEGDTMNGGAGYPVALERGDGDYKFRVASSWTSFAPEFYDDAATLEEATVVPVQDDPVALTVDLAPQGAIVGQVRDDAGEPIPFASVALYVADGPHVSTIGASSAGVFVAPAPPGDYQLRAYSPSDDLVGEWYGDAGAMADATVITLPASGAGVSLAPIRLGPGGSVAGTVTAPGGAALAGVQVGAFGDGHEPLGWATTDASGDYRIDGLFPEEVTVAFHDDLGGYRDEWWDDATDQESATAVEVTANGVAQDVDAELALDDTPVTDGTAVTGRALDAAGRPLPRVWVSAYAQRGDAWEFVDDARTDRFGRYVLDEIDEETSSGEDTVVKLLFEEDADDEDRFGHVATWYGGRLTEKRATPVTVPWDQMVSGIDTRLGQFGGLRGTVTASVPLDGAYVIVQDDDGRVVWADEVAGDGTWSTRSLLPGTYRAQVQGVGYDPETFDGILLAPRWWKAGNNFTTATPITVTGGAFPADVDVALTDQLTAYDAPVVTGKPVVGQVLRATSGRWNMTAGTTYAYTWLRGATVVGRGSSYRPTVADAGATLRVRVDAAFWDWDGTATSAATATVKQVSRTAVSGAYAKRRRTVTLGVRVIAAGLVPTGTVRVTEGRKVVRASLVLEAGAASLVVAKPTTGTHTYVVTYPGSSRVLGSSGQVTVRVKKA